MIAGLGVYLLTRWLWGRPDAAVLAGSVHLVRPITSAKQAEARKAAWTPMEAQLGLTLDEVSLSQSDTPVSATRYTDLATGFHIWVSTPPLGPATPYTGAYAGSNRVLFAWVEKDNPSFFSRILGIGDQKVSAWATSGTSPSKTCWAEKPLRRCPDFWTRA